MGAQTLYNRGCQLPAGEGPVPGLVANHGGVSLELDMEPRLILEHLRKLPKAQDMTDLQARVDYLFKANGELRTRVEEGEALCKEEEELKDRIKALEVEVKSTRKDRDKAMEVAQKIHAFVGYLSDVVNKARLYDQCAKQLETSSGAKVIRCMVNYSTTIKKLLKEMYILLESVGAQPKTAPATQQPTSTPALAPTPVPVPTASLEMVTSTVDRLDPIL